MSKKEHLKIFIRGVDRASEASYDAIAYEVAPVFFALVKPNEEKIFFPWGNIEYVCLDGRWAKAARDQAKRRAEEEGRIATGPSLVKPPKGIIVPK